LNVTVGIEGSDYLFGEEALSTSHVGPRFSTSFVVPVEQQTSCAAMTSENKTIPSEIDGFDDHHNYGEVKNTKGFGCVYKSLFKIFSKKKGPKLIEDDSRNGVEMTEHPSSTQEEAFKNHVTVAEVDTKGIGAFETTTTTLNASDANDDTITKSAFNDHSFQNGGYLPSSYKDDEPQDFARDMILRRQCYQFDPSSESPVSLASAFRRSMSPTVSSCAGSELSSVQALISVNHTNVAQHVGWLREHFQSPKAMEERNRNEAL